MGSRGRGWQISRDAGRAPRWARDTGELFFVAGSGGFSRRISVVDLSFEPAVRVRSTTDLFATREARLGAMGWGRSVGFEVAPDGQRLIAVRSSTGASSGARMILVQNWMELLRPSQ